ncbi:sugar phosphate isomerase/epimerase family protein [Methanoregula sp. UBA64]|jgi:sugar phosphate isomerase/epimerase|uniref:sugar phosphate isomerase/epimerase family protein n=1 Tax=Methanoregula sp. UBA64 TaxID=1915554 RepID=UPI0025DCCD33|nr:sugar phosphate isomerase/epimerase family protein [Methanoregula sp. UBA64]
MTLKAYFSSSSKVWDDISWVYGIKDAGYAGWEIVADGNYRLEKPENIKKIKEAIASTGLGVTVHAPYGDLNLATLNDPIWRESIRQIEVCIEHAADLTDRVTIHPGYLSPAGKLVPQKVWELQKEALRRIGKCAAEYGVLACLENMILHKEFLCRDCGELMGMAEGIEGIGLTFDFGHANTVGKVPDFLAHVGSANHIHIHDNHGESDEHLALGDGTIDWHRAGKAIAAQYSGVVVVEGRSVEEAKKSLAVFTECFV